jgi:hypothetical protein
VKNIDDFLALLKNVKPGGLCKWKACCPAHNDGQHQGDQSLSIGLEDEKILLKCFACCQTPDIVKTLGLTMSDLFIGEKKKEPVKTSAPRRQRKIVAVYPYHNIGNKLLFEVVRYEPKSFTQRRPDGDGGYINNLSGVERVIYRLPWVTAAITRGETILNVEGEKDADNLVKLGLEATTSPQGAAAWNPSMASYYTGANLVVIIPDKDEPGRAYAREVAMDISAHVHAIKILELPGDGVKDASDWIAAGGTAEQLAALISSTPDWRPPAHEPAAIDYDIVKKLLKKTSNGQYTIVNGAFHRVVHTREGEELELPLCNFTARIIDDIFKDNGAAIHRFLKIQGRVNGSQLPVITIPEAQFDNMKWVRKEWGFKTQLEQAKSTSDHLVNAISKSSGKVPERTIFTHTGWRDIGGKMVYLTAGGAIGLPGIEVELPPRLARYRLPQPDGDPKEAIEKSLDILLIADNSVTVPTFILPYLAVLNIFEEISFSAFYTGRSGSLKSVITALALSHFGNFTHKTLPVNWMGTRTELEKLSFLAKDILFAIDDYAPPADSRDARELNKTVEYILRAFANRQGKVRSNADMSSQETFYPRGLHVTSGEQLPPPGVSRSARILPIPVKIDDFYDDGEQNYDALTRAQQDAKLYPLAMAHYIKWIQDNWQRIEKTFHEYYEKYRLQAPKKGVHLRLVESVALMQTGYCIALQFACEKGALKDSARDNMLDEGWDILAGLLNRQNIQLTSEKPGVRFIEVLQSLLASGRAAFRTRNDAGEWAPALTIAGQSQIGWEDISNKAIYLNRAEAYSLIFNHCQRMGEYFGTHADETWQDMKALGYLEGIGPDDIPTIKKRFNGQQIRVLPLKRKVIYPDEEVNS